MNSCRTFANMGGADVVTALEFSKGDAIYQQGDPALFWFELVSGMVRTSHLSLEGRRQITGFFGPNEIFGADQGTYISSAEVVTPLVRVRRARWGATAHDDHSLKRALMSAENSILLFGHRTAAARIAAFLLDLYARMGSAGLLPLPMPRCDIADYLGLTPETVSRTMTMLTRRRFILQAGPCHIRIRDIARLNAVAKAEDEDAHLNHPLH